jgi:hypothetical protein
MQVFGWVRPRPAAWVAVLIAGMYSFAAQAAPEPAGWFAGDIHVHRSCGGAPVSVTTIRNQMAAEDISVVALLADMGNGEVQNQTTDLPLVNGQNDPSSTGNRIIHWEAEWHWDATYGQYPHQALGGHIVALGLTNATQIWKEYSYPIFQWARNQGGIAGFAHMQYLDNGFPQTLTCCTPIEYPVEVALGACDFISEDVAGSDSAMQAYYRLLNCGFRPGFAAGSDSPCAANVGAVLTYVQVSGSLTYQKWIQGIANKRTVVSRNGHKEFLDLKVNGTLTPGDELSLASPGNVNVSVQWLASLGLSGTIELVQNGVVVASQAASVAANSPVTMNASVNFTKSGWLCARRMGTGGHQVHTAAVFVKVANAPVRASVADAQFYVDWMNNLLQRTSPGGEWSSFFVTNRAEAQARYQAAKTIYQQIAAEAAGPQPLSVTPATLPNGLVNVPYSTTLAATGGTTPYTWSIVSGSLPAGLALNASSGAISGTPTAVGNYNFTARVRDASNPIQSASNAFNIAITSVPTAVTIWPASAVPGLVDGGADSSVELGVKFRSDVSGNITGIRFYKSTANTGTHTANLWTSTGTRLATATFINETASGWQQVNFATPVAITSNTVYVASYHCNNGHYSADQNYFATSGIDNPPLHALANGVSGGNGVYAYGTAASVFPNQTWNTANYWVDVVLQAGPPPTLNSIAVTPANPSIAPGATQQFTATGTYSDGSTQNLTSQAGWVSSNTTVATVSSSGLATALTPGTSGISATFGGKTGGTTLTVQSPPLTITTSSLSNGTVNVAYSNTLAATGGTTPYRWSVLSGSLPAGLTLNTNTGGIGGTPAVAGLSSFTVQVSDSSVPVKSANKALSISVSAALNSITVTPANPAINVGANQQFTATGNYSDGTTQNLTSLATWVSSNTVVATINSGGLATGRTVGTAIISATTAGRTGTATLTVQPAPLAITTTALPGGTRNVAYSTSLAASGGTTPYSWSIASGSLPTGLSLNSGSGAITGTPSATGTFNFTARVTDTSNPVKTASNALSIVIAAPASTVTIWPSNAVPGLVDGGADSSVELGVKFRSDVAGNITGIRFYKASGNTGTHTANLWSSTGTRIATATFTNETASGWQQANFAAPVAITANTVYVASYHCNNGHYSADVNYFASSGVDNPPLHALANGVSGGNGVYAYGTGALFPNQTWNAANYWIDVAFQPGADSAPPTVTSVTPLAGAIGVSTGTAVTATFSEGMNASTIGSTTFTLRDASNSVVAATVSYDSASRTATLTPASPLNGGILYTATAKGGVSGVADLAGNRMSADFTWSFTTVAAGPSNPNGSTILVLTNSANPFSSYYSEILLTEGLNQFALRDVSTLSSSALADYDVVLLGQVTLTAAQVTTLSNWVGSGGNLIAMRPDKKLAGLLGLTDAGTTLSEGYLLANTNSGPGAGIVGQTIQFHGTADRYTLSSASSLATLYSSAQTSTANPAVTVRSFGSSGGEVAAFTYDLARSVVLTRQGNPAWAGQDRDGLAPLRSDDLFYGPASFDPQPNWVDLNKVAIPQADEQQRLLANLILYMNSDKKLLPRFWYFPSGHQAVVVMTGDDHAGGGTAGRFDHYMQLSAPGASVDDWQAIRGSSYIYPNPGLTSAQASFYNNAGFDLGVHLNTGCGNYTRDSLISMFNSQLSSFQSAYPSLPPMKTHRVHCIAWSGYTILPEVEATLGIRLDTTYYYYPPNWVSNRPGVFTGSGMPMRFATTNGALIDVYQATTQMTDESGQTYPFTVDTLLDRALGPEGYYGAFVANMHTDLVGSPGSDQIVQSALNRGVPIISARQLLTWLDGRNGSRFSSISWSNNTQTFSVTAATGARNLQAMAPVPTGFQVSNVRYNGSPISFYRRVIKGIQYAFFPAVNGTYQVNYIPDATAPAVSSVSPPQGQTGVSQDAKIAVMFNEPMDPATINTGTLTLLDSTGTPVARTVSYNPSSFTATLKPNALLRASDTHTAGVAGGSAGVKDLAGNPLPSSLIWNFTTASSTFSIWNNSTTPAVPAGSDTLEVEVGVKFRSSVAGRITGIKFYKGIGNSGTHVGKLWTSTGTLLASVTFVNETASGWQTQTLATPVSISANTTYVVSYHAPNGRYAYNSTYFASSGVDNPPLRALSNSESGGNGVYRYGASDFPNQTYDSENYWVDVLFQVGP